MTPQPLAGALFCPWSCTPPGLNSGGATAYGANSATSASRAGSGRAWRAAAAHRQRQSMYVRNRGGRNRGRPPRAGGGACSRGLGSTWRAAAAATRTPMGGAAGSAVRAAGTRPYVSGSSSGLDRRPARRRQLDFLQTNIGCATASLRGRSWGGSWTTSPTTRWRPRAAARSRSTRVSSIGGVNALAWAAEGDLVTRGGDGLECDEERIGTALN